MDVENMEDFEELLSGCRGALERFVHCKVPSKEDAEDVLQETYMSAYRNRDSLKNREAFRAWIFSIARNKCNDYFAAKARKMEISIDEISEQRLGSMAGAVQRRHTEISDGDIFFRDTMERCGSIEPYEAMEIYDEVVHNTLEKLKPNDKEILSLYYFKEISQADIAKRLGIPVGTVKSRLHTAKRNFRENYPLALNVMQNRNGINETKLQDREGIGLKTLEYRDGSVRKDMEKISKMPEFLPEYKIIKSLEAPFGTRWEELMGWFLVPRLNEQICWGMYDWPSRKCTEICRMKVLGEAEVHGIRGVEISVRESDYTEKKDITERSFVAQLTDTHCRYLAHWQIVDGIRKYTTFLDGDSFMRNWGFGEDNCGNEVDVRVKGDIIRNSDVITCAEKTFLLDVVGRYKVTINGRTYDTICVMDVENYIEGAASEQYIDKNGRTILWRRFNRNNWKRKKYGGLWTELLPDSERLTVNGEIFVHWYDCITDYIF